MLILYGQGLSLSLISLLIPLLKKERIRSADSHWRD